jgi:hypothetical protein
MGKKELQREIRKQEGYILSDGTCNLQHLLPKAYDLMENYGLRTSLKQGIREVFNHEQPTFYNQYYGKIELKEDKKETANYLWNEDIYNYFNDICPAGYYFGSSEGDGACIGFFKFEDEMSL